MKIIKRRHEFIDTIFIDVSERINLKKIIQKIVIGEWVGFYFRREEDLTNEEDLAILKKSILDEFSSLGEFEYIQKLSESHFDSIGIMQNTVMLSNSVLQMWECFYSISIFQPTNILQWDEYKKFALRLACGEKDVFGYKHIEEGICDFILMKNTGGDELILSCKAELTESILEIASSATSR